MDLTDHNTNSVLRVRSKTSLMAGNGKNADMKQAGGSCKKLLDFLRTPLSGACGFTSIELVIVILVLGVLTASIIIKNPFSISDYSSIAADQLIADIQYLQIKAMGIGSARSITFYPGTSSAREYTIQGESETRKLPTDRYGNVVVTGTNFGSTLYFNSLGEPCLTYSSGPPSSCTGSCNATNGCSIGLGTGTTTFRTIKVYAITGKVE